jgi:hypothetical protein
MIDRSTASPPLSTITILHECLIREANPLISKETCVTTGVSQVSRPGVKGNGLAGSVAGGAPLCGASSPGSTQDASQSDAPPATGPVTVRRRQSRCLIREANPLIGNGTCLATGVSRVSQASEGRRAVGPVAGGATPSRVFVRIDARRVAERRAPGDWPCHRAPAAVQVSHPRGQPLDRQRNIPRHRCLTSVPPGAKGNGLAGSVAGRARLRRASSCGSTHDVPPAGAPVPRAQTKAPAKGAFVQDPDVGSG